MRVGQGFDAHRFKPGDRVFLGGVEIPFEQGLAAHSDGDVLLHAICDALLGAVAEGDIGRHFPDSEPAYKGVSSRVLLKEVAAIVAAHGVKIVNIDATVIAEQPRIAKHVQAMRENISEDANIPVACVNVKGTTTERMGFTGRGEGIAAMAVCLVE